MSELWNFLVTLAVVWGTPVLLGMVTRMFVKAFMFGWRQFD